MPVFMCVFERRCAFATSEPQCCVCRSGPYPRSPPQKSESSGRREKKTRGTAKSPIDLSNFPAPYCLLTHKSTSCFSAPGSCGLICPVTATLRVSMKCLCFLFYKPKCFSLQDGIRKKRMELIEKERKQREQVSRLLDVK